MKIDETFFRYAWMTRSVRLPSQRRLALYAEAARRSHEADGLKGMMISCGIYRLHVLEGDRERVDASYQALKRQAAGVGVRLIQAKPAKVAACTHSLTFLDLQGAAWAEAAMKDLFERWTVSGDVTWQQLKAFLAYCIDYYSFERAA